MIKIGIIGCGYWGPNLIRNFSEVKGARVVACADVRPDRLQFVKQRYPAIEITKEYNRLLQRKDIDAVSIATPASTHFSLAREALAHNKHVLIEKPMTKSSKEAQELIRAAKDKKRVLMVGHTFEYAGAVRKIRELLSRGEIGDIFYFDSTRANLGLFQIDVNVIWDLAPHDLSIMLYALRLNPVSVLAVGNAYVNSSVEDICYITLFFPKKIIGHIHISWLAPVKFRRTVIAGSKKMIVYDDVENIEKIKVFERGVTIKENSGPKGILERQLFYQMGDVWSPRIDTQEPLKIECEHFIDCVKNGKTPFSDGSKGLEIVRILEAVDRSIKEGGKKIHI